jgi:hypothetical protein
VHQWRDPHLVMRADPATACKRLFLFLCGSYGMPARQQLITATAARLGYHAINLSYPNAWTVGGLCRDSLDADCHGKVRQDILVGGNQSGLVALGEADPIETRLRALLRHLDTHHPADAWGQYLNAKGDIDWSRVVVAGHSQGGGQAAMIGKCHPVARVVMLAAPVDHVRTLQRHARWIETPGATAPERYFGFVHAQDQGFDKILRCWALLGLDHANLIDVDQAQPPYGNAQCLVTQVAGVKREKYHASVAQDNLTPQRLDGQPLFEPVWRYLLSLDA